MRSDSLVGHVVQSEQSGGEAPKWSKVDLKSDAFESGEAIPDRYSAEGGNVSPPLRWGEAPEGTREWLLICEDPDAPRDEPFIHWILSVPEHIEGVAEGVSRDNLPLGAHEARNDSKSTGYFGPRPPKGHGTHHYHFQIFAVDSHIELDKDTDRQTLVEALQGHVRGFGELTGTYETRR
jgi:Raf kinase inhibitor-like YbhB/YbcL family protein